MGRIDLNNIGSRVVTAITVCAAVLGAISIFLFKIKKISKIYYSDLNLGLDC